jgi:hypothetical protein
MCANGSSSSGSGGGSGGRGGKVATQGSGRDLSQLVADVTAQTRLQLEAFAQVLRAHSLPHIVDVDFSCFPLGDADGCRQCGGVRDGGVFREGGNSVTVHFSRRNPAQAIGRGGGGGGGGRSRSASHTDRKLLVAMYPAAANAYPGNRYWDWDGRQPLPAADAALDAAMSCTVAELHCPEINPCVSGLCARWYGHGGGGGGNLGRENAAARNSVFSLQGGDAPVSQFSRAKKSLQVKHGGGFDLGTTSRAQNHLAS